MPPFASKLAGSHVLITGGNKGIGRTIAESFLAEGANVSYCGRSVRGDEFALFKDAYQGARAVGTTLDIADVSAMEGWVEDAAGEFGGIDTVIANASPQLHESTVESWQKSFEANILGLMTLINTATPHLSRSGSGSILIMSSLAGWEARYHTLTSPYPTMKRAQGMLAKNYSKDLAPRGVRVNSLVSGAVETPNLTLPDGTVELSTWHAKMQSSPEAFEGLFETIPMRRAAKPEETANAVIFLSTHLASYITGASLFVDGGMSTIY